MTFTKTPILGPPGPQVRRNPGRRVKKMPYQDKPVGIRRKYHIPWPNNVKYARAKCQAKFRKEYWSFTPQRWWELWLSSGVLDHRTNEIHGYCMVRIDPIAAWDTDNCIIVSRRQFFIKCGREHLPYAAGMYPPEEWQPRDAIGKSGGSPFEVDDA